MAAFREELAAGMRWEVGGAAPWDVSIEFEIGASHHGMGCLSRQ
jgi:hypothetical protein